MEQNLWPAIRSETAVYMYYQYASSEEARKLEALQSQLKVKQEAKARLVREEDTTAKIEILDSEIRAIEESIVETKSRYETDSMEAIARKAKLESKIESFSTSKWVRVTRSEDLTAIEIIKTEFPKKKLRFCLGRKARSVGAIQRIAGFVGIGVMDVDTLYELSDRKFNVVSDAECRILHFRKSGET